jgi:hypothetical protein
MAGTDGLSLALDLIVAALEGQFGVIFTPGHRQARYKKFKISCDEAGVTITTQNNNVTKFKWKTKKIVKNGVQNLDAYEGALLKFGLYQNNPKFDFPTRIVTDSFLVGAGNPNDLGVNPNDFK